jgi:hypothetical protein
MVEKEETVYVMLGESLRQGFGSMVKGEVEKVREDGSFTIRVVDGMDHNSANPKETHGWYEEDSDLWSYDKKELEKYK